MKITKEEVLHVAKLARLDMDDAAVEKFSEQIGTILAYMESLDQVDTRGVTPTSHAVSLGSAFREDEETGGLARDAALVNAPEQEDGCFVVPRIVK
ncbi:Asp-tRNA(Asn)/Glu-tRNA(Gln) amidotransferase subunit GatC [Desulfococcus sp.]|uniref:Asp-tRNA(Asn)/Glu-tRNA(Gln) amidotransferase subunit GatC n=1 Tax=Desulfococcus sp. TaxID=2025834 RepID=UPI0035948BB9